MPSLPDTVPEDVWGVQVNNFISTFADPATGLLLPNAVEDGLGFAPLNKAGDTMTGPLILAADPTTSMQAATKGYVDNRSPVPPVTVRNLLHAQRSHYDNAVFPGSVQHTTIQQGGLFRYVAMQGFNNGFIADLKTGGGDNVRVCLYKEPTFSDNTNTGTGHDNLCPHAVGYIEANGINESWFGHQIGAAHDAGHRQTFSGGRYALWNLTSTALRSRAAANIIQQLQSAEWDGVFIDNCLWQMTFSAYPDEMPNQAAYQAGMEGYLAFVTAAVVNAGFIVYGNIGSGFSSLFVNQRKTWLSAYFSSGGAMEEGWTQGSTDHAGALSSIENFWVPPMIQGVRDAETLNIHTTLEIPVDDYSASGAPERIRYAIGLFCMASRMDGTSTLDIAGSPNPGDGAHYYHEVFPQEYNDMANLGLPSADYVAQSGGCYLRQFPTGIALLNPHNASRVCALPLGKWSGWGVINAQGTLTMAATTAKILTQTGQTHIVPLQNFSGNPFYMNGTVATKVFTLTGCTAGSTMIFACNVESPTQSVSTITDDQGNTWTRRSFATSTVQRCEIWVCNHISASGDLNVTVVQTAAREGGVSFDEISFLAGAMAYDTQNSAAAVAGTTITTPTLTPGNIPAILFCAVAGATVFTHTADDWSVLMADSGSGGGTGHLTTAYIIEGPDGTGSVSAENTTFTMPSSTAAACVISLLNV